MMVLLSLSLSCNSPLPAIFSSNVIIISVALFADVPSAGVTEVKEGAVVSGIDAVKKGKVKVFSIVRPSISLTAVVTTIVY